MYVCSFSFTTKCTDSVPNLALPTGFYSTQKHVVLCKVRGEILSTFDSDWLRAGRSGDRIPVGARLYAPIQTGPGAHPASCTVDIGSFPG